MNPPRPEPTRKEKVRTAATKPAIRFYTGFTFLYAVSMILLMGPLDALPLVVAYLSGGVIAILAAGSK